jgi:hypothetical protein
MNDARGLRNLYESCVKQNKSSPGAGRQHFITLMRHSLGLCDAKGNNYRKPTGERTFKEAKIVAESVDVDNLANSLIGYNWKSYFDPSNPGSLIPLMEHRLQAARRHPGDERAFLEAAGVGAVDPSAFANISAWTSVVGGLLEIKILEGFNNPKFIANELMPPEPTNLNGQKIIGDTRIGDQFKPRKPGEAHQRMAFGERWVLTPETEENAGAVEVFKETAFFSRTGEELKRANGMGEWLAYRKEIRCIDTFIGVNSQVGGVNCFNYKGSTYSAYVTQGTGTLGYNNFIPNNELLDLTAVNNAWLAYQRTTDPETGTRIMTAPNTVVVNPAKVFLAKMIFNPVETERRQATGATQATASTLLISRVPGLPVEGEYKVIWSPLIEQRCTDATGLGLTQASADKLWWWYEKGKPFRYMQNWPLKLEPAPPTSYDMIDRGVILAVFANERGTPSCWGPWWTQMSSADGSFP